MIGLAQRLHRAGNVQSQPEMLGMYLPNAIDAGLRSKAECDESRSPLLSQLLHGGMRVLQCLSAEIEFASAHTTLDTARGQTSHAADDAGYRGSQTDKNERGKRQETSR